ncbi:glycosyltransferase family 4 protein [Zafaria sp. J156]|uniref:glycosyltransferase family 4 protein n=1 Tax=Zafaria sp. J156 TaxID=3116490 RepID=UPI002E789812|nr:glycosyltransferase family 4 protein [Zafaria sp. J156]MEE1620723.1 glycosyltransferase family 4 protein [Zafaria sp. J156]
MRVLLLTHSYDPESTPPQRRWAAFIGAFRREGWDVDVVVPTAHPDRCAPHTSRGERGRAWTAGHGRHGEWIRRVPLLKHSESRASKLFSHLMGAVFMVPAALLGPRPDVVVVTVPALPNIAAGYAVSRLRRRPLVVEMRDAWPDLARDADLVSGARPGLMERIVAGVQRKADLVVTVTRGFAELLRQRGCRDVVTVNNGISLGTLPHGVPSAPPERQLHVLYLGNHGESQGLETIIDAARLAGEDVKVRFVGTGTRRMELEEHARGVGASIEFLPPSHGEETTAHYAWADTCVISLRDDWPSFDWTVPSKTYELLAVGRHITGIVRGEAARILTESGAADVLPADPTAIAAFWREAARDRGRLQRDGLGRDWVRQHGDYGRLSRRYMDLIAERFGRTAEGPAVRTHGVRRKGEPRHG